MNAGDITAQDVKDVLLVSRMVEHLKSIGHEDVSDETAHELYLMVVDYRQDLAKEICNVKTD